MTAGGNGPVDLTAAPFVDLTGARLMDLTAVRLGAMVLAANDEYFAPKEALLDPAPPRFDPDAYTDRGKLMDGWETRRRRSPGADWCVIRLGLRGTVRRLVVDTRFFVGNSPEACSVEQALVEDPVAAPAEEDWLPLLARTTLSGDTEHILDVGPPAAATHLRLNIYPDGGVARFRALGEAVPDLRRQAGFAGALDLAALANGAAVIDASGEFFSPRHNLIMVGDARTMGDGWETRRRRGRAHDDGDHDWVVVRLATAGLIDRLEIDTTHFKGNNPAAFSLEALEVTEVDPLADPRDASWREVVPRTPLAPHQRHGYRVQPDRQATHVRLRIFPDGGVARLRVFGRVSGEGWQRATLRWLNTATHAHAVAVLSRCCASRRWCELVAAQRPFDTPAALHTTAERVWWDLDEADWQEAFAAHPRIGDRTGSASTRREQQGTQNASPETRAALADANRRYEERFDLVFLICATGKSADDMLDALEERIRADPATELRTAAGEQAKITALRLERLLGPDGLDL